MKVNLGHGTKKWIFNIIMLIAVFIAAHLIFSYLVVVILPLISLIVAGVVTYWSYDKFMSTKKKEVKKK